MIAYYFILEFQFKKSYFRSEKMQYAIDISRLFQKYMIVVDVFTSGFITISLPVVNNSYNSPD
jgi:hypothetical protein